MRSQNQIFRLFQSFDNLGPYGIASSKIGPSNKLHTSRTREWVSFSTPRPGLQPERSPDPNIDESYPVLPVPMNRPVFSGKGTHITSGTCATNAACRDSGIASRQDPPLPSKHPGPPSWPPRPMIVNRRAKTNDHVSVYLHPPDAIFATPARHLISIPRQDTTWIIILEKSKFK